MGADQAVSPPPRAFLLVAAVSATCGCANDAERFAPPATVPVRPEVVVASLGILSDTVDGTQTLSLVKAGGLSASGRFLAAADQSAPFVRLLDRATGSARAFGAEGSGPGELLGAHAIEFLGDSVLLVLSPGQRLNRFDVSGEWWSGIDLREAGVLVSSITSACGGVVYAYGVPGRHRQLDTVPWVHRLDFRSEIAATPRLRIPGTGYVLGYGALQGFDGSRDGILLWHKAMDPEVGYWLPCDGAESRVWSHGASGEPGMEPVVDAAQDRRGMALSLPDTIFTGAAVRGSVKIRARRPRAPGDAGPVTRFHVVRADGCHEVGLIGEWSLHDAHADGLVLSRQAPFPAVEVVDWSWFEEQLTPARCAP